MSSRESVHRGGIGRIDAFDPRYVIEGAVGAEDLGDSAILRDGGEQGVAGVEGRVTDEELVGERQVTLLHVVEAAELGDEPGSPDGFGPITGAAGALVQELLDEVDAGLTHQRAVSGAVDDLLAGLAVGMSATDRIDEDGRVEEKAAQSRSLPP